MPTPWTPVSRTTDTPWNYSRFWGAYLKTAAGDYVTDVLWRRIVVIVAGGSIPLTNWTARTPI